LGRFVLENLIAMVLDVDGIGKMFKFCLQHQEDEIPRNFLLVFHWMDYHHCYRNSRRAVLVRCVVHRDWLSAPRLPCTFRSPLVKPDRSDGPVDFLGL
jgi:hypothetical protein